MTSNTNHIARKEVYISGNKIQYLETNGGSNPAVLILHGWASEAQRWQEVMVLLQTQGVRAIAIDLPGFGGSPAPKDPWSLDDYARFVLHFIENTKIENFYILGHSFGGRIAIKLAADHAKGPSSRARAEGLTGLILVGAAGVTPRDQKRIFTYKALTKVAKLFFALPFLRIFRNTAAKGIYWLSGSYDYYVQKGAMKETFKQVIEEDLTRYLPSIQVSTHIIWGKKDKMTPLSDAYLMRERISGSKLSIIENGNHSLHLQLPKILAEEITKGILQTVS